MCLNTVKLNNRVVAILSVVGSIIGATLIADWQSIGFDPCIKYSVFHDPDIEDNITSLLLDANLVPATNTPQHYHDNCTLYYLSDQSFQARLQKSVGNQSHKEQGGTRQLQCNNITSDDESGCLSCDSVIDINDTSSCMTYRVNVNDLCYDLVSVRVSSLA